MLRITNKNLSIHIRRNIITYIHISFSTNISICVYIGLSTNMAINMNMFSVFVGALSLSVLLKVSDFVRVFAIMLINIIMSMNISTIFAYGY